MITCDSKLCDYKNWNITQAFFFILLIIIQGVLIIFLHFFSNCGNKIFQWIFQSFFAGYGPSLKANFEAEPFENIELYNLMTRKHFKLIIF